jgi:PHP family Zn ribbon phosphoesterase
LDEVLGEALGKKSTTKPVQALWDRLVELAGSEMNVLLFAPEAVLLELAGERVAQAVMKMRRGEVQAVPGYDGVYGRIRIFSETGSIKPGKAPQLPLL